MNGLLLILRMRGHGRFFHLQSPTMKQRIKPFRIAGIAVAFHLCSYAYSPGLDAGLEKLRSPVIFRGDSRNAYRDPMLMLQDGFFRLFFTKVEIEPDGRVFSHTAWSKSRDLVTWTEPVKFTPRNQNLNYGSPGNIVRDGDEWVLCLQTYPRPNGERFGNGDSRIWTMRSKDLETWGPAELLRVSGPDVAPELMGRMIDPFLLADKDVAGKWHCYYKSARGGILRSTSLDLKSWTPAGKASGGENPCVVVDGDEYVLSYSPEDNGIGMKRSKDGVNWRDAGILKLGQDEWKWAAGRITAGFMLDLRSNPQVGKILMVFHGSDFRESDPRGGFDNFASIGIAWSDDFRHWSWPACQP
jgi:hypothetical protein